MRSSRTGFYFFHGIYVFKGIRDPIRFAPLQQKNFAFSERSMQTCLQQCRT